jgi:DNA-binding NarL/FixJ family response regulator
MPIMSGIEVATEIKGINREIPVLLMTAHDTPNLIKEIKALGLSVISKSSGLGYIAKEVAQNYSRSNVGS